MPFLIGCDFETVTGWRARECILAPKSAGSRPRIRDGLLWVQAAAPMRPGRFMNPRKILAAQTDGKTLNI